MKALSIRQPWASLIMAGVKTIETRSWRTSHRGPLAIHAAKTFGPRERHVCQTTVVLAWLDALGLTPEGLPRCVVLGTAELVDCLAVEEALARIQGDVRRIREKMVGDYTPGRLGWVLSSPRPLRRPVSAKGALSLWTWEP